MTELSKKEMAEVVIRAMRNSAENVRSSKNLIADPALHKKFDTIADACTDCADYVASRIEK